MAKSQTDVINDFAPTDAFSLRRNLKTHKTTKRDKSLTNRNLSLFAFSTSSSSSYFSVVSLHVELLDDGTSWDKVHRDTYSSVSENDIGLVSICK